MPHKNLPLAVSCGDPAGVGPDVILSSYAQRAAQNLAPCYVLGDIAQLQARAALLDLDIEITAATHDNAVEIFADALPVIPLNNALGETPGAPDGNNAAGIIEAIERGTVDCFAGRASGLVTAPISKAVLYERGFGFPGHTEFLGALASQHTGQPCMPVMMIAGPDLRTVPVTIHIPLSAVFEALSPTLIADTIRIVDADLRQRFCIALPRIAVAGLNPHAGENGTIGTEDSALIAPVLEQLRAEGLNIIGPLPSDTMFHAAARANYDVAVCMYHDQALIPAKTLAFDDGTNATLGLPMIRTSPDHGTAFDIAGTGKARPNSFIAAVKMAQFMADASR